MERHDYVSPSRGLLVTEGLTFYPEKHEYFYNGRKLSGITGAIGKGLKKNFETSFVDEGRVQGSHIHAAIEEYIKTGNVVTVHPAARWAIEELRKVMNGGKTLFSEVLISDFNKFATACDVLARINGTNDIIICDTKAGVFDRKYVTLQLSIEKWMIEETTNFRVKGAFCISTRDREFYPILFKRAEEARAVLYK